jgi:hypothetical protein
MMRVIVLIALVIFSDNLLIAQNKFDFNLTSEMEKSVKLNLEAISILDSVSEIVWPGWSTYKKVPIFIGSPNNNAVLINPQNDIPEDFKPCDLFESKNRIFAREHSGLTNNYNGTIIKLNDNYYRLIRMSIYDSGISHYYMERVSEFIKDDAQIERIKNLLQSQDYYISINTHEAFHFHQKNKKYSVYYKTVEPRYYTKSKVLAYSYIEGMLLKRALYAENVANTKELICQFLAIRELKSQYLSKRQRVYEKFDEYQEGTAQYVQTQIQVILDSIDYQAKYNDSDNSSSVFMKASDFLFLDSLCMEASIKNIKDPGNKHYFYGQTQAKILDKLCGNAWKNEILQGNIFLIDLLVKYSEYDSSNKIEYLRKVSAEYDYKKILKEVKKIRFSKKQYILNE